MEVFERLQAYFEEKKISQVEIAEKLGVSKSYVNALFAGRKKFGKKQAEIWENLFGLSKSWLLTGEGEMMVKSNYGFGEEEEELEEEEEDLDVEVSQRPGRYAIPFYDATTTGGFEGHVSSSHIEGSLIGYINPGGWFNTSATAAIRHVGESMAEYPDGCILAVREVRNKNLLVYGQNYVVQTSEYMITKRIQRGSTRDTLSLYSTNQEKYPDGRLVYEPFEVELSDIYKIFKVIGYVVNQSGEVRLIRP